jgi:hypothetical protein
MRRRQFITVIGSAAAWSLAARAQQPTATRRIGVLMNFGSDAPEGQARVAALMQALQKLGWNEGDNIRTDVRWPGDDEERFRKYSGGLAAYGPNTVNIFGRAATYVDRVLKGAKPSELPVQAPNKYELVINLKTAKTLGLEIPPALIATADEVIE